MQNILLFLLLALGFVACEKNTPVVDPTPVGAPVIRWNALAEGQMARYVLLRGEDYTKPQAAPLQFLRDTLVVEVKSKEPNGWLVHEYLTKGSASRGGANQTQDPLNVYRYYWDVRTDSLVIRPVANERVPSTRLFGIIRALPLQRVTAPLVREDTWMYTFPNGCWGACLGLLASFSALEQEYRTLTVLRDDLHMGVDGLGYTLLYQPTGGLVRSVNYEPRSRVGYVWTIIGN